MSGDLISLQLSNYYSGFSQGKLFRWTPTLLLLLPESTVQILRTLSYNCSLFGPRFCILEHECWKQHVSQRQSVVVTPHCTEHFALRHKLKSCTVTFLNRSDLVTYRRMLYRPDVCNCTMPYVHRTVPVALILVRQPCGGVLSAVNLKQRSSNTVIFEYLGFEAWKI